MSEQVNDNKLTQVLAVLALVVASALLGAVLALTTEPRPEPRPIYTHIDPLDLETMSAHGCQLEQDTDGSYGVYCEW